MKFLRPTLLFLALPWLLGCASKTLPLSSGEVVLAPQTLHGLQALSAKQHQGKTTLQSLRYTALKDTAMSIGARAGLASRAAEINALLSTRTQHLDDVFNFRALLLKHQVLPPVLVESQDNISLPNAHAIRIVDKTYHIVSQAHFVTNPPSWRDYLWMHFKAPDMPDKTLLPKTPAETAVWKKSVQQGWQQGHHQAEHIYQENLRRLTRDFKGMSLYRQLLLKNMISLPYVAQADLGVTHDKDSLHIHDHMLRLTKLPELQTNSATWNPVLIGPSHG